jgi:hypothetical protein
MHKSPIRAVSCSGTYKSSTGRAVEECGALEGSTVWHGISGQAYPFDIFPLLSPLRGNGAVVLLARENGPGRWVPLYIADGRHETLANQSRLLAARREGATHAHWLATSDVPAAAVLAIVADLSDRWHPLCSARPSC